MCFPHISHLVFTVASKVGAIIVPILWVRKQSLREYNFLKVENNWTWFQMMLVWHLTPNL